MDSREVINAIKDRIDLVDLVGRSVKLRKSGPREWVGCCPFHGERTPSFYVIPDKHLLHCFGGCGHFDAFSYLQKSEGLTFPEALEELARMTGVELPKHERPDKSREDRTERMRCILEESNRFFQAQLVSEDDAMAYLQGRGLSTGFILQAQLGAAPPTWDMLVKHLQHCGYRNDDIEAAGVAAMGQKGSLIDALRNRITIPIRDHIGKLVAFGGRILGDEKPKYLNTRETDLFRKGSTLYGLHHAKAHLQEGALVVEGYFDVLTLQMLGIHNVVAPLGTALTEQHLERLGRYTKRIILCFDGDEAGHKAMEKTLAIALPEGFDVRLLELPGGHDPDTWASSIGGEAFRALIRRAPDWTAFKLARLTAKRDLRQTAERMAVLADLSPLLAHVPEESRGAFYATVAHQLELPVHEVAKAAGAPARPEPIQTPKVGPAKAHESIRALAIAWLDGATRKAVVDTPRSWWQHLPGADGLEEILDHADLTPETETFLKECEARAAIDGSPNLDRLLWALEWAYIDGELRALRRAMEDPSTDPVALPGYAKAQAGLLTRRSRLNRGRLIPSLSR